MAALFRGSSLRRHTGDTEYRRRYTIGCQANGSSFDFQFPYMPHLLVAGATGGGKSTLVNGIGGALASRTDLAIAGIDLKRMELSLWEPRLTALAKTAAEADQLLADVLELVEYRQHLLSSLGRQRWLPTDGPFLMLVIDEFARLAGIDAEKLITAARADEPDTKLVRAAKDALAIRMAMVMAIAALARAVGVWLVGATQYPTAEVIDNQIRTQFETRVMLRVASREQIPVILGQSFPQITVDSIPVSQRGGFWCVGHPDYPKPVRGRSLNVTGDKLADRFTAAACNRVDAAVLFGPSQGFLTTGEQPY